jgi:carbon-monoxide dehydrogenase medium subunit
MNPAPFAYHRAASVDEAIALLGEHGADGKLLAGGHSLLPVMKLRLAEPGHLIDIGWLPGLRGVREHDGGLDIGALTTHRDLERDPLVAAHAAVLAETAAAVGDRQVRARGTLGGALAHADAAADEPAAVLALGGEVVARGPGGERVIPADQFFVDFLTTALAPDEVLTSVRIPAPPTRSGGAYEKLANQASGYALVGVAVVVALDRAGRCAATRVGLTGAIAAPRRATGVESALLGSDLGEEAVGQAASLAADGFDLLDDLHASSEYRRRVVIGLTRRAILRATARARAAA